MADRAAASRGRWPPIGVTARAGALIVAVSLAVLSSGPRLGVALALSWGLAVALHRPSFAVLRRPALWGVLLALALPPLAVTTPRDVAVAAGLAVSSDAVVLVLSMIARTLIIVVAASGFASTVSVRALTDLLDASGVGGLGFSLGVALHTLPIATRTWTTSARALSLRGGFTRHRLRDITLLAVTVISNALRHADEVVEAAQARGFTPTRRRRTAPAHWRSDLAWIAVWAGLGASVLLVGR